MGISLFLSRVWEGEDALWTMAPFGRVEGSHKGRLRTTVLEISESREGVVYEQESCSPSSGKARGFYIKQVDIDRPRVPDTCVCDLLHVWNGRSFSSLVSSKAK